MPVRLEDDSIARSIMLLCLGTAGGLALVQWQIMTGRFDSSSYQISSSQIGERSQQSLAIIEQSVKSPQQPTPQAVAKATTKPLEPKSQPAENADSRIVVNLSERQVQLYRGNQLLDSYAIAVAKAGWETPTGTFKVLDMEQNPTWVHPITGIAVPPGSDNPLGAAWIGFWSNGEGEIGFHGTNQEELIGEAVSHGCLRMRNEDVRALYTQVAKGTPVIVEQ
jgi:L,D-transpeptidase ErfK/SrfK